MNDREIATEYRLFSRVETMRECVSKGENNKEFCQSKGVYRNTYFYWQAQTACGGMYADVRRKRLCHQTRLRCKQKGKCTYDLSGLPVEVVKYGLPVPERISPECGVLLRGKVITTARSW